MIKVEPDIFDAKHDPGEPCCLCGVATRFWFTASDVACCPSCAEFACEADIPTKREWLNRDLRPGENELPPNWTNSTRAVRRLNDLGNPGHEARSE